MAECLSMPYDPDTQPERVPNALHQLAAEHSALDIQLRQLREKRFPSPEDEIEETRLKKLKLHVKDTMRQLQT